MMGHEQESELTLGLMTPCTRVRSRSAAVSPRRHPALGCLPGRSLPLHHLLSPARGYDHRRPSPPTSRRVSLTRLSQMPLTHLF